MTRSIFFVGPVERAIAQSITVQKPLVCFITDEEEQSKTWEEDYLNDEEIAPRLSSDAVTVRLIAGTPEASNLAAFIPMTSFPVIAVIKNGAATDVINNDVKKEDLIHKLSSAIAPSLPPDVSARIDQIARETHEKLVQQGESEGEGAGAGSSSTNSQRQAARVAALAEETRRKVQELQQRQRAIEAEQLESGDSSAMEDPELTPNASTTTSGTSSTHDAPPAADSAATQAAGIAALAEGTRARLAQLREKREKENLEAEKEREKMRREGTKARAEAVEKAKERGQLAYIAEQKKRKEWAVEERKRVLGQIEADKQERKYREQMRKMQEQALAAESGQDETPASSTPEKGKGKGKAVQCSDQCALSFRLLDGSNVRGRFPSEGSVARDVRSWLDKNRTDGDYPYKLRILRPPQPSKPIDSETSSLLELGLTPNASLILVPAGSRASSAYPIGTNWLVGIFLAIWNVIRSLFGIGINENNQEGSREEPGEKSEASATAETATGASSRAASEAKAKRRIRTLHDTDSDNSKNEWYNGNQLDTIPPPKIKNESDGDDN